MSNQMFTVFAMLDVVLFLGSNHASFFFAEAINAVRERRVRAWKCSAL